MSNWENRIGIRWIVGDLSVNGFEALRYSVWGARKAFGPGGFYGVCVNSIAIGQARTLVGSLPPEVQWYEAGPQEPERLFPNRYELILEPDCVLWSIPEAIRFWLEDDTVAPGCVLMEGVSSRFGAYAPLCGTAPRSLGIRGLPPGFDVEGALRTVTREVPCASRDEFEDGRGLWVAALSLMRSARVVSLHDVSVCRAGVMELGACGAHFEGLGNKLSPRQEPEQVQTAQVHRRWLQQRERIYELTVGLKG